MSAEAHPNRRVNPRRNHGTSRRSGSRPATLWWPAASCGGSSSGASCTSPGARASASTPGPRSDVQNGTPSSRPIFPARKSCFARTRFASEIHHERTGEQDRPRRRRPADDRKIGAPLGRRQPHLLARREQHQRPRRKHPARPRPQARPRSHKPPAPLPHRPAASPKPPASSRTCANTVGVARTIGPSASPTRPAITSTRAPARSSRGISAARQDR